MNTILIYCRSKKNEPNAEQTACILSEQLQHLGLHIEISHQLNLPRLLLNSYQTVHFIIENLPLTINEAFYFSLCKAIGKSTLLSLLNSEKKLGKNLFDFMRPDAFSVSQINHLKLYRDLTGNKFILSAFPKPEGSSSKNKFTNQSLLIPLQNKIEESFDFEIDAPIYFDGRKLLKKMESSVLRKKWNELLVANKINSQHHLILSENKITQLIVEEQLAIVLADPNLEPTEFTNWLSQCMNKNNLIILNDFQATGFSNYWTSGHNCLVISAQNWIDHLNSSIKSLENSSDLISTSSTAAELFESKVNELSRLYAKLWQQKTSLLTSGSVKL